MRQIWPEPGPELDHAQLEDLYTYPAADRRWLAVNFVSSADGAVEAGGTARALSNPPDRAVLQLGSDLADVVLVGATTAMVEGFRGVHPSAETLEIRRRRGLADIAATAVVTTGSLPGDAPAIAEAATPTFVLTCESAPRARQKAWKETGAEVIVAGEQEVDLAVAVGELVDRGMRRIDCEGGPHLFGALLSAGVVDELRLTVSPLLVSGAASRIAAGTPLDPVDLELASVLAEDGVLLLRYLVGGA
ncbi:dihydrofolate reductase family protein [Saccharopolyspora griseoalba]|uniref:Dihydrofolate reductase family protein n=1 Tax=Saccharopolyspora griseoalba TaxID=1431848 RepID=A0ABW2LIC7_9PSEU